MATIVESKGEITREDVSSLIEKMKTDEYLAFSPRSPETKKAILLFCDEDDAREKLIKNYIQFNDEGYFCEVFEMPVEKIGKVVSSLRTFHPETIINLFFEMKNETRRFKFLK
jgi:hypothetical protein